MRWPFKRRHQRGGAGTIVVTEYYGEPPPIELLPVEPSDFAGFDRGICAMPVYMNWAKVCEGLWPAPMPGVRYRLFIKVLP